MLKKVLDNIIEYNLIDRDYTVIAGVSGGYDSMVMLHCLMRIKDMIGFDIEVAHINHMIRAEADGDEEFVRRYAESNKLTFSSKRESMDKLAADLKISSEDAGRRIRYSFFNSICDKKEKAVIAVAHNLDDQVETVLLNMMRGSGLNGLTGMRFKSGNIIRPLLSISRSEIEEYAKDNSIDHREDITNRQSIYRRNSIRNKLIPFIEEEYNPNIKKTIFNMSDLITEQMDIIDRVTEENLDRILVGKTESHYILYRDEFNDCDEALRNNILRKIIMDLKGTLDGFERNHLEQFTKTAKAKTGKYMNINNIKVSNIYDKIKIGKEDFLESDKKREIIISTSAPGRYKFGRYEIEISIIDGYSYKKMKNTSYFSLDELGDKIKVRTRRNGDFIYPYGMRGRKKIKDIFIDAKVEKSKRDEIPIITTYSDEIIWIAGFRRSSLYTVKSETKKILRIKIGEKNES